MFTKRVLRLLVVVSMLAVGLIMSVPAIEAQGSANISDVVCEATHSGGIGYVHYTFTITFYGLRGQRVAVGVWPRYASNDELITLVGSDTTYQDRDGYIVDGEQVTPNRSPYTYYGDFSIPASVFPAPTSRSYDVYPDIEVQAGGHAVETDTFSDCLVSIVSNTPAPPIRPAVRSTPTPAFEDILDPTLDSTFGSIRLRSGFLSDPYSTALITGGDVSIDDFLVGSCPGYAASAPDFEVAWSGSSSYLRFYFDSSEDTTMVVYAPDGKWYCDDDSAGGTDPQVSFFYPDAGTYSVWIGDYDHGNTTAGYLYVSELSS